MNMSKRVKTCFVRGCVSNSEGFPDKVFVTVPQSENRRRPWFEAARKPFIASKTTIFCCEDHFAVPEDFENYMRYKIMGGQILMKKHVVPHKFNWQTNITLDLTCKTDSVDQTEPEPKLRKISADNMPSASGSTSKQCNVGVQSSDCEVCFSSFSQIIKIMDIAPEVKSEVLCDDYLKETQSSSSFEVCTRRENLHMLGDVKYEVKEEFEQAGLETKILKNEIELVKEELQVPSEKNNDSISPGVRPDGVQNSGLDVLDPLEKLAELAATDCDPLENNNANKEKRFKCDSCEYQCNIKSNLKKHSLVHKNWNEVPIYKCNYCEYQTKYKGSLVGHLKRHSGTIEKKFKCELCDYRCVCKSYLIQHSLIHKKPEEVTLYKCDSCDFQTKYKESVLMHTKRHLGVSGKIYKCDLCDYRCVAKSALRRHSIAHKNPDEVTLYKCNSCDFRTKYRKNYLVHTKRYSTARQKVFKCNVCNYRCTIKCELQKHYVVHKNTDEVPLYIYRCNNCDYQTNRKGNLVAHSQRHSATSAKRFMCAQCDYRFFTKYELKKHSVVHKTSDEVPLYQCDHCNYQTKFKGNLVAHSKRHSEKRFKCDICDYHCATESALTRHTIVHKNPEKVPLYKCSNCDFQTKYIQSILKHAKRHVSSSDRT